VPLRGIITPSEIFGPPQPHGEREDEIAVPATAQVKATGRRLGIEAQKITHQGRRVLQLARRLQTPGLQYDLCGPDYVAQRRTAHPARAFFRPAIREFDYIIGV
jgi:hypothetical protein